MKNKIKCGLFLIFTILFIASLICGCAGNKYFTELKAAYSYGNDNGILKKFPSEITWNSNEILVYNPEKKTTNVLGYEKLEVTLPKKDYATGEISDYKITMAYAVHNGSLIFTEVPIHYLPHEYYIINGSVDSVIVTVGDGNAFLVNLNDASHKKLFDGDTNAKTISISPDGMYLLYLSNDDLYSYDIQTGTETNIMNFGGKEFLCWEKNAAGNFLFREINSSDMLRYSLSEAKEYLFYAVGGNAVYEMIDDRYIYVIQDSGIYIYDIYSSETITVNAEKYFDIWNVVISENEEYLAFFGSYINSRNIYVTELVTLNIKTHGTVSHYNQKENEYIIESFFWCPGNVLAVNFINKINLYRDLCRLHNITH